MIELEENKICFYFNKNKLIENFNKYSKFGTIYYPLKTNSNKTLLKELQKLTDKHEHGFLISSITNFETLQTLGVEPTKMCFINVLAENGTIRLLYEKGEDFLSLTI